MRITVIIITLLTMFSCKENTSVQSKDIAEKVDVREQSLEVVSEFYNLIDTQNIEKYGQLFTEDCQIFFASSKTPKTFKEVIPFVKEHYKAFPDYKHIVEAMYADGEFVTVRVRYTGTHEADFFEQKASGNKVDYKGLFVFQVHESKIIKVWAIEDDLGLREQLNQ